jgi:hypothetical protein
MRFGSKKPKRYVRDDEIKFRDRKPENGQMVKLRIRGNKTYYRAVYTGEEFRGVYSGAYFNPTYVMGWIPMTEAEEAEVAKTKEAMAAKNKEQ